MQAVRLQAGSPSAAAPQAYKPDLLFANAGGTQEAKAVEQAQNAVELAVVEHNPGGPSCNASMLACCTKLMIVNQPPQNMHE